MLHIRVVVFDINGAVVEGKENGWGWFQDRKIELVATTGSTVAQRGLPGGRVFPSFLLPEHLHLLALRVGPEHVLFVSDQEINVRRAQDTWGFHAVAVHPATGATYRWPAPVNSDRIASHVNLLHHLIRAKK